MEETGQERSSEGYEVVRFGVPLGKETFTTDRKSGVIDCG